MTGKKVLGIRVHYTDRFDSLVFLFFVALNHIGQILAFSFCILRGQKGFLEPTGIVCDYSINLAS